MKDMVWYESLHRWILANGRTATVCLLAASLLNALGAFERKSLILVSIAAALIGATCLAVFKEAHRRAAEKAAEAASRREEENDRFRQEMNELYTDWR